MAPIRVAAYAACKRAADYCRSGKGPALVHGHVIRPYSHSLSDDEKLYRPDAERQKDAQRDPITRMQLFLIREDILDEAGSEQAGESPSMNEIAEASERAEKLLLARYTIPFTHHVYSQDLGSHAACASEPKFEGNDKTMADLINVCLKDEMKRDQRIVMFGEDVADCSREEYLREKQVKGKGGVFKLTAGLQCEYGSDRVFNSPLAEANIVGRAVGMATRGLKPVVEIQFFDYIWPAMQQLRNELPLMRWRSNNSFLVALRWCALPSADI